MSKQSAPELHYGVDVTTDEDGETYWLRGHHPDRRAIAAANRYARRECGLSNAADDPEATLDSVVVSRLHLAEDPERRCAACGRPQTACPWQAGSGPEECCDGCSHPEEGWLVICRPETPGATAWTRVLVR